MTGLFCLQIAMQKRQCCLMMMMIIYRVESEINETTRLLYRQTGVTILAIGWTAVAVASSSRQAIMR